MPPQNGLFINSRYKLVTYSQCGNLDEWTVVDRFAQLGAECIVGRELHADGGTHLHVFADFGRKFRSRDARILDVGDRHPNVVASWGTPEEGYDYAIKDGDVVAGGLARPESSRGSNGADASRWARIADAGDREEFFALVRELDPKTFVTRIKDLEYFADRHYRSIPAPYESPPGIGFVDDGTDGRSEWVLQSGIGMGEPYIVDTFSQHQHHCRCEPETPYQTSS
uniref:Replication-associated protein n=1 Tax=Tarsiger cyanurus Genomoviridae sp. TaxID=2814994 RepID=A0A8A4XDB5_9VIRU